MTNPRPARKLRILMIADHFWPAIGGGETVNYEISRRLVERGHSVTVLTRRTKAVWPLEEVVDGIEIRRYDDPEVPRPFVYFAFDFPALFRATRAFESLLKVRSFDVIVLHAVVSPLAACLSRRAKPIPKLNIFYAPFHLEHEVEFGDKAFPRRRGLAAVLRNCIVRMVCFEKRLEQRFMVKQAAQVVVFSEYSRRLLRELAPSLPAAKVQLMPIGVDTDKYHAAAGDRDSSREALGLAREQFVLFTLRRLVPRMGLDNLIRAMPRVSQENGKAILVVGGDGPQRPALEALVEQLGLQNRVRLLGSVKAEDVVRYYRAADLFVLPTRALEGIGLPTLESFASGLPVVGTPVGATLEIISKVSSDLLTKGSEPDDIAEGIVRFMRSFGMSNEDLSARCRKLTEDDYSWPGAIDEFESLLQRVSE